MTPSAQRAHWFPRVTGVIGALSFLGFGVWAMAAPESFFDAVAAFEPYNQHFIQDVGAFQIGLGVVLLLAVVAERADGLAIALLGAGVGAAAHVLSHVIGLDVGGSPGTDIPLFAITTVLLVAGGIVRWRERASD